MKKLCFGTIFTLLYLSYKGTKKELYESIENIIGIFDSDYTNQSSITRRANGQEEFPKFITKKYFELDMNVLVENFNKYIVNKLRLDKKEQLVLAIKDILLNDKSIPSNRIIGKNSFYTKKNILKMNEFYLPDLIANIFLYSINIENRMYVSNIKKIKKEYLNSFEDKLEEIIILENPINK